MRGPGLNLMADNGCQPTSLAFMRACAAMGIRQAFTSYSNPKGNADTERFLRTLKEELVWLREWTSPTVFFEALERWIADYNTSYLHSALGYRSPEAFEAEHLSHATPLAALAKRGAVHEPGEIQYQAGAVVIFDGHDAVMALSEGWGVLVGLVVDDVVTGLPIEPA